GIGGLVVVSRRVEVASGAVVDARVSYDTENGNNSIVSSLKLTGMTRLISEPIPAIGGRWVHHAQAKAMARSSAIIAMSYRRGTNNSYHRLVVLVGDPRPDLREPGEGFQETAV
ncbi:cyclase atC, partial [Apiospora aurea]